MNLKKILAVCLVFISFITFSVIPVSQGRAWPPIDPSDPQPPNIYNVSHTKGEGTVTVSWTISFQSGPGFINRMEFRWKPEGESWQTLQIWDPASSGSYSWTVENVANGIHEYEIYGSQRGGFPPYTASNSETGTVYMGYPDLPVISNIQASNVERDISISWDITWEDEGPPPVTYLVELHLSENSEFSEPPTVSYDHSGPHYTYNVQVTNYTLYWYQIEATCTNGNGLSRSETAGPNTLLIPKRPIADAYVSSQYPDENYPTGVLWARNLFDDYYRAYLKFEIPDCSAVVSATLHACVAGNYNGGGTICAYATNNDWTENTITANSAEANNPPITLLDEDTAGSYRTWDSWDVTWLAQTNNEISIILLSWSEGNQGAHYYSRETTESLQPYLEIKYFGTPYEAQPGNPLTKEFFDDYSETIDAWDKTNIGVPSWTLDITAVYQWPYDTCLAFDRGELEPSESAFTGYRWEQTGLTVPYDFYFVARALWFEQSIGAMMRLSIQLLDSDNYVIAEIGFYDESDASYGYIISQISGYTPVNYGPLPSTMDAEFELYRNPFSDKITLGYDGIELTTEICDEQVTGIRLQILSKHKHLVRSSAGFDHVTSREICYLKDTNEIAPFENPIENKGFEDGNTDDWQSNPSNVGSAQYLGTDACHGNWAWHVDEDEELRTFSLTQTIETNEILSAIANQHVTFTFYAKADTSIVTVRANLIYFDSQDDQNPITIFGGSMNLTPNNPKWTRAFVTTPTPLPYSLSKIIVKIEGIVNAPESEFSAYFDTTGLSIVDADSTFYLHDNYVGSLFAQLNILEARVNAVEDGAVLVLPYLFAEAAPGYNIMETLMVWEVFNPGEGAESYYDEEDWWILEGNDKDVHVDPYSIDQEWEEFLVFSGTIGKILGISRDAARYLSKIWENNKYLPYIGPILSVVDKVWEQGTTQMYLSWYSLTGGAADSKAEYPGDTGHVRFGYHSESNDVSSCESGVYLDWKYDTGGSNVYKLRVTFTVTWGNGAVAIGSSTCCLELWICPT